MYPHRIRLREPWTITITDDDGGYWLQRGFHRPTIDDGERVWVVCEGMTCNALVLLDDRKLGMIEADGSLWSRDITALLVDRHKLTFELLEWHAEDSTRELPWREVRLEVRLHSSPE